MTHLSTLCTTATLGEAGNDYTAMWVVMFLVAVVGPLIALGWWRLAGTSKHRARGEQTTSNATVVHMTDDDRPTSEDPASDGGGDAGGGGD